MQFKLKKKLILMAEGEVLLPGEFLVEVITFKEYKAQHEDLIQHHILSRSLENIRYCKVDLMGNYITGTFVIPSKDDLTVAESSFGYYMSRDTLVFIDDTGFARRLLNEMADVQVVDKTAVAHILFEFMEYLLREDVIFLQQYEEKLADMEEMLMDRNLQEFNKAILESRKELLRLDTYYSQLREMGETLSENYYSLLDKEDCHLFHIFAGRASRLYTNTQELKEYTVQIREMYQSQMDLRQNNVIQFLTVVTTIFMPLTLIVGWYGMNFTMMPELHWKYGYLCVIGVSAAITLALILYFIKKKWFSS